jgi:hypothetical protein
MTKIGGLVRMAAAVALVPAMLVQPSLAWESEGHMMINRLAAESLPKDLPEFMRTPAAANAMEYYGPDPDRWRESGVPELGATQAADHFIDMEYADFVGQLPRKRYDFIRALAVAQKDHPDIALTPEKVGLQPYATTELWEKLVIAFRHYRELSAQHKDTKPVEAEALVLAGLMGHYVADGSNPLHASIQYNGWTGPNPNGYTTLHTIHSKFEGKFVRDNVRAKDVAPLVAKDPVVLGDVFTDYMKYLRHSNSLVEKVYQLDKTGAFDGAGTPEGKAFVQERLAASVTQLRDMIYTAWVRSGDPVEPYKP